MGALGGRQGRVIDIRSVPRNFRGIPLLTGEYDVPKKEDVALILDDGEMVIRNRVFLQEIES